MVVYTPMIQQYLDIKANYQDAFLFFRLGDFYELFFEDAELAAKILEITLTGRDGGDEQRIPMCGVPHHSSEAYIMKLIDNGYKVAICEQVEDPKEAKGVVKREVIRVITPGTVMEGRKLQEKANNYIACMVHNKVDKLFGIAISDISTGEFYTTNIENIDTVLNELSNYNPAEIIIESSLFRQYEAKLKQIETTYTYIQEEVIITENELNLKLADQFNNVDPERLLLVQKLAIYQILNYLQKTQMRKLQHFNKLLVYDSNQFMIIDNFSRRNLELTQTAREQTKKGSLIWLLDQTETAMGSRLLRRWLEKPLLSKFLVEERLNIVEELINDPILLADLNEELKSIYDIERIISKVSFGNATPKDLYNLMKSLEAIPNITQIILKSDSRKLKRLIEDIDLCQDIVELINSSIVDDPPISSKLGGIIKRGYNEQLDSYVLATDDSKEWLSALERRERELTGIKSLKVGFNKVFGYYIEVTKSNLAQVPTDRYIRKQTLANAERYITEELKNKEEIILEAEEKMLELEYQLFVNIRDRIGNNNSRMQDLAALIAKIDVLLSFSKVSIKYRYVRPKLNLDGLIRIDDGRHPVIEAIHNEKSFIPNDVFLNRDSDQILLITGPNMAGKSTYMRQVALIAIMAQIGCYVPAKYADIAITDRIFTRIGAGDDLTSGQSTFMVEMLETNQALTQATPNSLILLDEIGRGTSTYDGMALAQAIIQYIHDHVNAMTLFSTHYHELTSMADHYPKIKNVHVNVIEKDGKVIFLHKIEKGKADKSYGIHVAELAGMPIEIIDNAKKALLNLEAQTKDVGTEQIQLSLFTETKLAEERRMLGKEEKQYKEIVKKIESLDLINMTPLEGFNILYELQKQLRK